jgi:integrase
MISRNVASVVKPPKVDEIEIESLKADEIDTVLNALRDHVLEPIAVLALSTGARRGEMLALSWACRSGRRNYQDRAQP